ncbi:MAG: hypothetical protein ABR526_02695 [Chthoniobacterales bacterium]
MKHRHHAPTAARKFVHRRLLAALVLACACPALTGVDAQTIVTADSSQAQEDNALDPTGNGPVVEMDPQNAATDVFAWLKPADGFSFAGVTAIENLDAPGEGKDGAGPNKPDEAKPPRLFHYSIRLGGRLAYSDNINGNPLDPVGDFFISLEPGISIGLGDVPERKSSYIRLDYSPNALLYLDHSEFDSLQHFIHLEAVAMLGKLTLSLFQDVSLLDASNGNTNNPNNFGDPNSDPNRFRGNRDVVGRNRFEVYATNLSAKYDLTDRAALNAGFQYTLTDYQNLFTTEVYSGDLFFDYKLSPQLTVGAGGAGGVVYFDDPNVEERFQEARVRFTYDIPKRFNAKVNGGVEFRQFGPNGRSGYTAPIVEVNLNWEPIDGTKLTFNARHRSLVSNSLEGQSFRVTGFNTGIRQRLTDRLEFGVTGGYEEADYFSTLRNVEAMRQDEFYFIDTSLDLKITEKWTAGLYYTHRENTTNLQPFAFVENQGGIRTSITF